MDDMDDQSQLEAIKLSFEYLKHLTTLSGAATLVVLALMDQASTPLELLAIPALLFGLGTIFCLWALSVIIRGLRGGEIEAVSLLGSRAASVIAAIFTAGIAALMLSVVVLPQWPMLIFAIGALLLIAALFSIERF
jgi:hypothetical protein